MIISASRRTDIPAFYHRWFMNRISDGFLLTRNPFNAHQVSRVSLKPQDVELIVFWTRNPSKLMQELPALDRLGHKYYFQYTITGYPRTIEAAVPKPQVAIETFSKLSDLIGKNKVIWRYDPILLSNQVDMNEHKRLFSKIAALLSGKTERVVISFSDFYKKTERNLGAIADFVYSDITTNNEQLLELSKFMSDVAYKNGMQITSCAEQVDVASAGIEHGKCIDERLIYDVFNLSLDSKKDKGQREECGCIRSIDIGMYNTCLHECSYCYATFSKNTVINNKKKHDENSPFLIGGTEGIDARLLDIHNLQSDLF
jgi:DNA repair photolyase